MKNKIEFIAFDADDTLWENEVYYYEYETQFCALIRKYISNDDASNTLFETEMKNLHIYGYGAKGMMLCMIEVISKIVDAKDSNRCVSEVIRLGQKLLQHPIELLDGVCEILPILSKKYKLILATKGDLLDQERKIEQSGLKGYFQHIEIMSNKNRSDYAKLIEQQGGTAENFLMIGNSLKSDIIPVLELGAYAMHIPHQTTWKHEESNRDIQYPNLIRLNSIAESLQYL